VIVTFGAGVEAFLISSAFLSARASLLFASSRILGFRRMGRIEKQRNMR